MICIPLRNRAGEIRAVTLIDEQDAPLALKCWHLDPCGYALRRERYGPRSENKARIIRMHRHIMGLAPGDPAEVDHINGDRLDNRRENLRIVSHAENMQNRRAGYGTSRHRGVFWDKQRQKWKAVATVLGKAHQLGHFTDEEDAARCASEFRAKHMPHSTDAREYGPLEAAA